MSHTKTEQWAVLPVLDDSKTGDSSLADIFGKRLSEAFSKERNVTSIPYEKVQFELNKNNVKMPVTTYNQVRRFSKILNADLLVVGKINAFTEMKSFIGTAYQANVEVMVLDGASGLIVNGAIAVGGSSYNDKKVSKKDIFIQALNQAAFNAVQHIAQKNIYPGYVKSISSNHAMIDVGANKGYYLGMELLILRNGNLVGIGKVTKLEKDACIIQIVKTILGISILDKVRPVAYINKDHFHFSFLYKPS